MYDFIRGPPLWTATFCAESMGNPALRGITKVTTFSTQEPWPSAKLPTCLPRSPSASSCSSLHRCLDPTRIGEWSIKREAYGVFMNSEILSYLHRKMLHPAIGVFGAHSEHISCLKFLLFYKSIFGSEGLIVSMREVGKSEVKNINSKRVQSLDPEINS